MADAMTTMPSPVGELTLVASDAGLRAILWDGDRGRVAVRETVRDDAHPVLVAATRQLAEYFAGTRTAFDVPLDPEGTPFQRDVWAALLAIPFGETRSYAQIARAVGRPAAFPAVGAANGRSPISVITLTGFAGGLAAKRLLLELERRRTAPALDL